MKRSFVSLVLPRIPGESPRNEQRRAQDAFPGLVAETPLNYWRPGDPIPSSGHRFLLCVATYSLPDLYFLDVLTSCVPAARLSADRLDVFNVLDCGIFEDFDAYFPGVGNIVSTPHAGYWKDGILQKTVIGGLSFGLITEHYGFDFDSSKSQDYEFLRKEGLIS